MWNPFIGTEILEGPDKGKKTSPMLTLAHELIHAYLWVTRPKKYQRLKKRDHTDYDDYNEKWTMQRERRVARFFREGRRFSHNAKFNSFEAASPISDYEMDAELQSDIWYSYSRRLVDVPNKHQEATVIYLSRKLEIYPDYGGTVYKFNIFDD